VVAERGGQVDRPRPAQHPDGEVAQAGHRIWAGADPDLGAVLGEGDVAEVVHRLDRPVPTDQVGEPGGAGLGMAFWPMPGRRTRTSWSFQAPEALGRSHPMQLYPAKTNFRDATLAGRVAVHQAGQPA
jgi:hypothetical protein